MDDEGKRRYGRTWNANESGVLWSVEWVLNADGTGTSYLSSPGVFLPPTQYPDEASMRAAFEAEADEYFGRLAVSSSVTEGEDVDERGETCECSCGGTVTMKLAYSHRPSWQITHSGDGFAAGSKHEWKPSDAPKLFVEPRSDVVS